MKLREIYELAIKMGMEHDVRGDYLQVLLEKKKREYEKLNDEEKAFFDQEYLYNPYSDTRILIGSGEEEVKAILCGIDIETSEILLADRLSGRGHKIDLVLSHHPKGIAGAALHEVMVMQADMLEEMGIPINVGEGIMVPRISEVHRVRMPLNHQRTVDAARLLGVNLACIHTPADNLGGDFIQKLLDNSSFSTVGEVMDILHQIPEYSEARKIKAGPKIVSGDSHRRAGRIFVKFTGGTATSEKAYQKLVEAGVGTMICMHLPDKHCQAARENNLNVIIAGHMASDSLGLNLFLDQLEMRGINIIPCSGLIRIKRWTDCQFH